MSLGTGNAASMASKYERDRDDQESINDFFFVGLSSRCREVLGHENVEQGKYEQTCIVLYNKWVRACRGNVLYMQERKQG